MTTSHYIGTLIEYHAVTQRRLWDAIMQLSDEQFVQDAGYSHGSIRNQSVHIASTDRRWLYGLKELPDVGHVDPADYPTRESGRLFSESVLDELTAFVASLDDGRLELVPTGMGEPVWQVLAHLVNHGTDHRALILQLLDPWGIPTFPQDFIMYLWSRHG